ncbi:3089_t:CDS:1, partial [Entrophospora sp. SA101]
LSEQSMLLQAFVYMQSLTHKNPESPTPPPTPLQLEMGIMQLFEH